ncbi:hypothetical protein [Aliivibrio fischeri]|uniref:hypothetical protein n=1 Tax=Aliivibrio fischeri TaxID=668 RepID=UPI0018C48DB9|nr:hypothetical protein [Aliivibrio fischeri]
MDGKIYKCGQCRQFTRTPNNLKDLCGAWDQPTMANRVACDFFMLKSLKESKTNGR